MRRITLSMAAAAMCVGASAMAQEAPAPDAAECEISARTSDATQAVMAQFSLSFEGYDAFCARLKAENMGVAIAESFGLMGDRSVGLVHIRLYERSTITLGSAYSSTFAITQDVQEGAAEEVLMRAIDDTLRDMASDPETYIGSVHAEIAALRLVMGGQ